MATNENEIAIRSSVNNLIAREKEHNLFKKKLQELLTAPMSLEMERYYSEKGLHFANADMADAINASLVLQAMNGNVNAFTVIRDTLGYKPVEQVKNDVVIRIDMNPRARELGE